MRVGGSGERGGNSDDIDELPRLGTTPHENELFELFGLVNSVNGV